MDLVRNRQTSGLPPLEEEKYAKTILAMSVLSVVLSAPLGAILIAITGPKLLSRERKLQLPIFFDSIDLNPK